MFSRRQILGASFATLSATTVKASSKTKTATTPLLPQRTANYFTTSGPFTVPSEVYRVQISTWGHNRDKFGGAYAVSNVEVEPGDQLIVEVKDSETRVLRNGHTLAAAGSAFDDGPGRPIAGDFQVSGGYSSGASGGRFTSLLDKVNQADGLVVIEF